MILTIMQIVFLLALSFLAYNCALSMKSLGRKFILDKYPEIMTVLEVSKNTAYNKLFRDEIMVHGSSGLKLDKENVDKLSKTYLTLVFASAGPEMMKNLIEIHGNVEAVSIVLINDLIERIEEDENKLINIASGVETVTGQELENRS